ncbi:MAG: calcium/sodium antiporter [Gammaproteobacteria bacterium]
MSFAIFAVSLATLLTAARYFTHSAERVGLALGMSPFAIGVLIVSAGTSLPELVSSVVAVLRDNSGIVVGNVLGANLSNLLLVTGAVAIVAGRQVKLGDQYILIDLHFLLGSALLLAMSLRDAAVSRIEAGFLLVAYVVYLLYLLKEGRTDKDLTFGLDDSARVARFPWRDVAVILAASAFIYVGARYTVGSLESMAVQLGIPPDLIALTLLSLGTTLPELVVSATAARRGRADVAVGNVLGSCVFNTLAVTGTAALVGPLGASEDMLVLPLPVFGMGALLFYLLTQDKQISRWEGMLLLTIYGLFMTEVVRLA